MPVYHRTELQALECTGCEEVIEIRRPTMDDPEEFAEFCELVTLDHVECDKFNDAHKAKMARKFRKKLRLRDPHGRLVAQGGLR